MKRNYIYYLLFFCIGLFATSCVNEEDDLFSKSAAERLNNAIKQSKEVLLAAPNGWVMEYYPTEASGGFTMLIKFHENGSATVAAQNEYFPEVTSATSEFAVIGDQGPVLTFNTYNEVMHLFSNPKDPAGGSDLNGLGLLGDYEFVFINVKEELITLNGKKRGTRIEMRPLSESTDWNVYLNSLYELDKFIFDSKVPYQYINTENGRSRLYYGSSHVFLLTADTDDFNEGDGISVPFIVTSNGIKMYSVNSVYGNMFQLFELSADKSTLVAQESNTTITGPDMLKFFSNHDNWENGWDIDSENIGGTFKQYYDVIVKNCKETLFYEEDFEGFIMKYDHFKGFGSKTLSFSTSEDYLGMYGIDAEFTEGSENLVTFTDNGLVDKNGDIYRREIEGFDEFIKELCKSSFVITADSPLRPSVLKLTSKENPANWIKVILN